MQNIAFISTRRQRLTGQYISQQLNTDVIKQGLKNIGKCKMSKQQMVTICFTRIKNSLKKKEKRKKRGLKSGFNLGFHSLHQSFFFPWSSFKVCHDTNQHSSQGNTMRHNSLNTNSCTSQSTDKFHSHIVTLTAYTKTKSLENGLKWKYCKHRNR